MHEATMTRRRLLSSAVGASSSVQFREQGHRCEENKETIIMGPQTLKRAIVLFALVGAATPRLSGASEPDWKAVEQALGKSGQVQAGGVFRVGMPRTDLSVTVKGVTVKPAFALGSYAAFTPVGDQAM